MPNLAHVVVSIMSVYWVCGKREDCVFSDLDPGLIPDRIKVEGLLWKIWLSVAVAGGAPGHSQAVTAVPCGHTPELLPQVALINHATISLTSCACLGKTLSYHRLLRVWALLDDWMNS